jgi:tyrosine-specific transport protein
MNISIGKFIGCVMMVIGSAIGAGVLAMPIQISGAGFIWSAIIMVIAWILLTITGLLVIEMSLALPSDACSFDSMATKTLGTPGKIIAWVSCLFLLCSLVAAYTAGESSLITNIIESVFHINLPHYLSAILFILALGSAVYSGTKIVDFFNRGLFSLKGLLLISTLILTLPHINIQHLVNSHDVGRIKYLFAATPVFLHLFNFHFVVPSIRMYVGAKPKELKWIVITGTTISLIIYLLWAAAALGIVPLIGENSFTTLAQLGHPADSPDFVRIITTIMNSKITVAAINGFYNVSMTTSFLGVSLGLFDFLADGLKRPNTRFGRLQTASLTFLPPLAFALFYPNGFIMALNYAASYIAVLCLILPALMVYRLRKSKELKSPYRTVGNNAFFAVVVVLGVFLFVLPILTNLHLLPTIK